MVPFFLLSRADGDVEDPEVAFMSSMVVIKSLSKVDQT